MTRFLSLWLPRLPADRARALGPNDDRPLVVVARIKGAQRLVGVDARAAALGLTPGLTLADARAMRPSLRVAESDPAAEAMLLARIADWLQRYTPFVALDGDDGLMLDIAGVAHLFGGEAAMIGAIEARLKGQGLTARAGVADNPRAAYALARFGVSIAPPDPDAKTFARLFHDLPLAALGIDAERVADLARAGLRRIGDVALRPRAPIAARFGADVIARLDALRGAERGAISPRFPPVEFSAERRFVSALLRLEDVERAILKLAHDLAALLRQHGKGARVLALDLFRVDGALRRVRVGAGWPLDEAGAIARLFREKLAAPSEDEFDAGYGIDIVRLSALSTERHDPAQVDFAEAAEDGRERDLADLVDRLGARLGVRRVTRIALLEAHQPEFAVAAIPAASARVFARARPPMGAAPSRPIRLFERPEPIEAIAEIPDGPPLRFRWRRVLHEVAAIEGPERIAAQWRSHADAPTRDYFRAEDAHGRRFWLYREGLWSETMRPRWFMHGVFA
jgi:protein ImuB